MKYLIAAPMALAFIFATATAASSTPDACGVTTTSDVNAALAPRVFVIDNSGPVAAKQSSKFAQVSTCTFVSKGATIKDMQTVSVSLRVASSDANGVTVKAMKEGVVKLGSAPIDVPGLGDSAYWYKLGGRSLVVLKGKRILFTVSENAPKRSDADAITDLKKIAGATLAKL